ncbi:hypothetical protein GW796_06975 [archaeon]|nr:hypothetical protein [archaeon]
MKNLSLKDTQQLLKETNYFRKAEESNLDTLQESFHEIQKSIETSLEKLQALKEKESTLQNKLFLMQKDLVKENLNVNGIKKLFSNTNFVKKIQEIKEVLDGTALDKQWIEEHYLKYKASCIKAGEEIKSKEEFKKIADSLKNVEDTVSNIQFGELFAKASKEAKKVGKFVQEAFSTTISSQSDSEPLDIEAPTSKKEGLILWLKNSNIVYSDEKVLELYQEYNSYLSKFFDNEVPTELIYSYKGGAFKQALKKQLS